MSRKMPFAVASVLVLALAACSGGDGAPGEDGTIVDEDAGFSPLAPDAEVTSDAAPAIPTGDASADAALHASDASPAPAGCGEFKGLTSFTCSKDGKERGKCVNGAPVIEACPRGCLRTTAKDDVCMGTTTTFSCTGTMGTEKAQNGDYYITSFGCWVDANKKVHLDSGDNCIPGCISKAQSSGLCKNLSGPQCEETVDWYVADSLRFGCLARLRVENPKNGKKVIVSALDAGPACWVERDAGKAILDASGRVNEYLFGTQHGWSDKALVHVVEVDPSTPLGPVP